MINDVMNYTGSSPVPESTDTIPLMPAVQQAEWDNIVSAPAVTRSPGWDTDGDGMPNSWEIAHGFTATAADNNTLTADGYTRLEHYLQYLTLIANWSRDGDGDWADYLNWRGTRP